MAAAGTIPSDNVFVSDLPAGITNEQLKATFELYGTVVTCRVLPPSQITPNKVAGLVRFDSPQTAAWVVENLNGNIPDGGFTTPVHCKFAAGPGGKAADGGLAGKGTPYGGAAAARGSLAGAKGGAGGAAPTGPDPANLYITGLPPATEQADLQMIFQQYGNVTQCKVLQNPNPAKALTSRAGLVRYATVEEANYVRENLNGAIPNGLETPIMVRIADPDKANRQPAHDAGGVGSAAWSHPAMAAYAAKGLPGKAAMLALGKGPGAGGDATQKDNLYIKGLPPTITEDQLKAVFSQYGNVTSVKVVKHQNGCCGLVRYATPEEASWVKDSLSGNVPEGFQTPVDISYFVPKWQKEEADWGNAAAFFYANKGKGKGEKGKFGATSMKEIVNGFEKSGGLPGSNVTHENNEACLYVAGLPPDAEDFDLYRLFSPFGSIAVRGIRVLHWPDGTCRGIGFVNFQDAVSAQAAIQVMHGSVLPDGTTFTVQVKKPGKQGGKGEFQAVEQTVKPGDWTCPTCGNLVFASKSVCKMCQTPKP